MTPDATPHDPKVIIMNLLSGHWNDSSVTTEYENRYDDFSWVIDDHFDTSWIHTGWFDSSVNNPQISVSFDNSDPGTTTGFDATTGDGGKSAINENRAYVDTWVQSDRDLTGGINPKKYAWQLKLRAELILLDHSVHGDHPWNSLGTGEIRSPEEPEDTPVGSRWRIPVLYSDMKRT